jgi:hypothetical protein
MRELQNKVKDGANARLDYLAMSAPGSMEEHDRVLLHFVYQLIIIIRHYLRNAIRNLII